MDYMDLLANGSVRHHSAPVPFATIGNTADSKRAAKTVLSLDEQDYLDQKEHRQTNIDMRSNRAVGL